MSVEKKNNQDRSSQRIDFQSWLETLQQESWQLELLISGLALYGVIEMGAFPDAIRNWLEVNGLNNFYFLSVFFFEGARMIFLINLLLHVVLRGLWIGAIGLRYVSGEIDFEALNYSGSFTDYLKRRIVSYDHFIENLEKYCSIIFAFTFLLFFIFLAIILFLVQFLVVVTFLGNPNDNPGVFFSLFMAYTFFALVLAFDALSMGGLKRIEEPIVSKTFKAIYVFFSFTTLFFICRPILYNFLDNRFTKQVYWLSIPYILLIFLVGGWTYNSFTFYPNATDLNEAEEGVNFRYYDDLRKEYYETHNVDEPANVKGVVNISLSSHKIRDNYATLFLKFDRGDTKFLKLEKNIYPYLKDGLHINPFSSEKEEDGGVTILKLERDSLVMVALKEREEMLKDRARLRLDGLSKSEIPEISEEVMIRVRDRVAEIDTLYKEKIDDYKKHKIPNMKAALLELHDLTIDGVNYMDSLDVSFYTHTNQGEKGFLCVLPLGTLSEGSHKLEHSRRKYSTTRPEGKFRTEKSSLPFLKLKGHE